MTGSTISSAPYLKAKCWNGEYWIQFKLYLGIYENLITFLEVQKLFFLAEMKIDFSLIPIELHGKGQSENLLQYLANNGDNNVLISNFLLYFLNILTDMRYIDDTKIKFSFSEEGSWQTFQLTVGYPPIIIYLTCDSDQYTCDDEIITCDQTQI
jgi:hypothetical protein